MSKYEVWIKAKKIPKKVSIIELEVLADQLGIDVASIRRKHFDAIFDELLKLVKAKGFIVSD